MIVLDANILIAHLDGDDVHHDLAASLLLEMVGDTLAMSPLTVAEVLVGPARGGQLDRATAALRQLEVVSVPLTDDAPVQLALLRVGTGLKLPDCCVLLAAEQMHAALATFDDRLSAAAHERGITVLDR